MSYSLLRQATKPRTEYLIIEAGVDSSSEIKLELPLELLSVVERVLDQNHAQDGEVCCSQLTSTLYQFPYVAIGVPRISPRLDADI